VQRNLIRGPDDRFGFTKPAKQTHNAAEKVFSQLDESSTMRSFRRSRRSTRHLPTGRCVQPPASPSDRHYDNRKVVSLLLLLFTAGIIKKNEQHTAPFFPPWPSFWVENKATGLRVGIQRSRLISARRQSGFQCSQLSKKIRPWGLLLLRCVICSRIRWCSQQTQTHTQRIKPNFSTGHFWGRPTLISLSRSSLVRMKEEPPAGAGRAPSPHLPRGLSAPTTQSPAEMTARPTDRNCLLLMTVST
jgi:hypothetical protein